MTTLEILEVVPDHTNVSSHSSFRYESLDTLRPNIERGRGSFDSYASNESQRDTQQVTTIVERFHQATDTVLIICGVIIVVSLFISLGIFIFGQYRMHRGLDNFVLSF